LNWQNLLVSINLYLPYFILFLLLLNLILLVIFFSQRGKINRLNRKYEEMMGEGQDVSLEAHLLAMSRELNRLNAELTKLMTQAEELERRLKKSIQKVGIVRFNAFDDVGSDLSFAVALLDEEDNGVVLTGIYGRDSVHTFAKPLSRGKSTYRLSAEEIEAVQRAVMSKNSNE